MRYKMLLAIFLDLIIGMGMLLTPQPGLGQEGVTPYSIETDLVNVDLQPGESWEYWIWVSNNLDREISVNVSVAGRLLEFLALENSKMSVPSNSAKGARVTVSVPLHTAPGTYTGYVVVECEGASQSLPVSLRVGEGKVALMDVNLEAVSSTIKADEPLRAHVSLYNLGTKGKLDVHLRYVVKEVATGREVAREEEDLQVETSHSFEKIIHLEDLSLESGEYVVEMSAGYDGKEASSTDGFEVEKPSWSPTKTAVIALLLLCTGTVSLKMYKGKRNERDEE